MQAEIDRYERVDTVHAPVALLSGRLASSTTETAPFRNTSATFGRPGFAKAAQVRVFIIQAGKGLETQVAQDHRRVVTHAEIA